MENIKYSLNSEGRVNGIGYNNAYPYLLTNEPFSDNPFKEADKWELVVGEWKFIKPELEIRAKLIELPMQDRAGYQRKLFIDKLPEVNLIDGIAIITFTIRHYLNDEWVYNESIQDKELTLTSSNATILQTPYGSMGEFDYLKFVLENNANFFDVITQMSQSRIEDGLIDSRLEY